MERLIDAGLPALLGMLWCACGGTAIIDPAGAGSGGGGAAGTGGAGGSSSQGGASTTSGPSGCQQRGNCPPNSVCLFETGECAEVCLPDELSSTCGPGAICDPCATGSCPGCEDCVAACVPAEEGQCDHHDDCGPEELCVFGAQRCTRACGEGTTGCLLDTQVCDPCATSSCPGCLDCLAACLPP